MQKKRFFYYRKIEGVYLRRSDFTCKRKQPFASTLLFMLNLLRKSLVVEINNFVTHLNKKFSLKQQLQSFTSSAFIQNRKKIKPEIFKYLSEVIINNYYLETNEDIQLFKGFRILAVDGSQLTLPFTKELRKLYGEATNASEIIVVNAKVSVLYDVLNRLALDSVIAHVDTGERELALTHFTKLKKNDLIIYDRGYPSYDFIHEHVKRNLDYLIRVKIMHSSIVTAFVQSGKRTVTTQMLPKSKQSLKGKEYNKDTGIEVRLVRVDLPSGETEVLVTSLLDCQKYPAGMFKKLSHRRPGFFTMEY